MLFSSVTKMQLVFKAIFSGEMFNKVERGVFVFLPNKKNPEVNFCIS